MVDVKKTLEQYLEEAVLQALPDLPLSRIAGEHDPLLWSEGVQIDFAGTHLQGSVQLYCSQRLLEASAPLPLAGDPVASRDWQGELQNLLCGRLKNRLLSHEILIKLNPPFGIQAKDHAKTKKSKTCIVLWFGNDGEASRPCLQLICNFVPDAKFVWKAGTENQILPGDAIYRLNEPTQSKALDMIAKIRSGILDDDPQENYDSNRQEREALPSSLYGFDSAASVPFGYPKVSRTQPAPTPSQGRRSLEALQWDKNGNVSISFGGGIVCTFNPFALLEQGTVRFKAETYTIELERGPEGIQVFIAELQISLLQTYGAA